jgi:TrkA domain protein
MDVEQFALPGIGLRFEITTKAGRRIGVVSHRSGLRELVIYDQEDPDACSETIVLEEEESDALAELLGAARIVERLNDLNREVDGLVSRQIAILPGGPYDGRTLGDTQARTRTGASVVAVVRSGKVVASPRPDFQFFGGDVVVVIGTESGTAAVADLFRRPD